MTSADAIAAALGLLAAYEAGALASDRFPTVSELVWKSRKSRWLTPFLWGVWAWMTYHFWIEVGH